MAHATRLNILMWALKIKIPKFLEGKHFTNLTDQSPQYFIPFFFFFFFEEAHSDGGDRNRLLVAEE